MAYARVSTIFAAAVLLVLGDAQSFADETKGRAVAEKVDRSYAGYGTSSADGEMILYTGNREARRAFTSKSLETGGDITELNLLVFEAPQDMRGVALLTHARTEPQEDYQWLYLPAASRTKRITSSNKSGKFVSSEFSYEDFAKQDVDEFTYNWLRAEPCPDGSGLTCEVIEAFPKSRKSGYSKRVIWADTQAWRARQIEYYNRRKAHEKTLSLGRYERPGGGKWRPMTLDMKNHLNNRRTVLNWSNYKFGVQLSPEDFAKHNIDALSN